MLEDRRRVFTGDGACAVNDWQSDASCQTVSRAASTRPDKAPGAPPVRRKQAADGAIVTSSLLRPLDWAPRLVPWLIAIIAMLLAAFEIRHSGGYVYADWHGNGWSNYDEGVYITSAWALNRGYSIFSQVFSSQPPLFLGLLALALRLGGEAAVAGNGYATACGVATLVGVAWLCWEIGGWWPALLGSAVLALSPGFLLAAHAIEAEAPMLAFGSLAVAAAARYANSGARRWLVAAGLLVAAATLSKLLAVALVLPLLVALALAARTWAPPAWIRRCCADLVIAAACVLAPLLAALALLAPSAQYDQVIRFHLRASSAYAYETLQQNLHLFRTFLSWDTGLLALAIGGVAVALMTRKSLALLPLAWLLAIVTTTIDYHPLFIHHLTVLLAPLAALAGLAAGFERVPGPRMVLRPLSFLVLAAALIVYAIRLPTLLDHDGGLFAGGSNPTTIARAQWLDAHSGPQDFVLVDDQTLAVAANRLVPPQLTDTSIVRNQSGYLPFLLLTQQARDYHVRAILLSRTLLGDARFVQWLQQHFQETDVPALGGARTFVVLP